MEVTIDFTKIKDWESFHSEFKEIMGFPAFYGRNMDAWHDCMPYIDEPDAEMSTVTVRTGESLEIVLGGTEAALTTCPDVVYGFLRCTAFVNQRIIESGSDTRLKLIAT